MVHAMTGRTGQNTPPRVTDPARIHATFDDTEGLRRLDAAFTSLMSKAEASATCPTRLASRDVRVVFGRSGLSRILDLLAFPHSDRDLAFCSFFEGNASFAWMHEGRSWVLSVATSTVIGTPPRRLAVTAARNVLATASTVLDVACGRARPVAIGGELADRVRTVHRLAVLGCCQSGDESGTMGFVDERVVGTGLPPLSLRNSLTLSAQGAALIPSLPSLVEISVHDIDEGNATCAGMRSPAIMASMPKDPMERLRMSAECEGLPILYRWTGR
jgi:hypothetical protein